MVSDNMNIKLARIQLPENKVYLSFLDEDNRNTVGYCTYDVTENEGHITYAEYLEIIEIRK
jgi:hypothetical protein